MKRLLLGFAAVLGLSLISVEAQAKPKAEVIVIEQGPAPKCAQKEHPKKGHKGQHNSAMKKAIQSGQITPQEARQLKAEKQNIKKMKAAFAADGVITAREKAKLERARNRHQAHLQSAMTNNQTTR